MHRTKLRMLAGSCAVVALVGCGGGGDSRAEIESKVAAQMGEDGLTVTEAACFANVVVDEIGVARIKDVDFSADTPGADLQDDIIAAATKAISDCDIDPGSLTDG